MGLFSAEAGANPDSAGFYAVYSDQPRGSAGYCAWHSSGFCGGVPVQFAFFFNLDGDPGCDPQSTVAGQSQGLQALANVTGHELSEAITDPQLNAWYDRQGSENADKCAWTFGAPSVPFKNGTYWKIQGNWSNAAANTNSGYANGGCIDGNCFGKSHARRRGSTTASATSPARLANRTSAA